MQLSKKTIYSILSRWRDEHDWDYCEQYGEPGYGGFMTETVAVVLGDYWVRKPDGSLSGYSDKYPRLWAALEEAGVHFEWYDEWLIDPEHDKAYRTQPDSYGWQPSWLYANGYVLTPDDTLEEWVAEVINDHEKALYGNVWSSDDLIQAGFTQYSDYFESGWHPGQNDNPKDVFDRIRVEHPDADIVFRIDGVGQFDARWEAYYRKEV